MIFVLQCTYVKLFTGLVGDLLGDLKSPPLSLKVKELPAHCAAFLCTFLTGVGARGAPGTLALGQRCALQWCDSPGALAGALGWCGWWHGEASSVLATPALRRVCPRSLELPDVLLISLFPALVNPSWFMLPGAQMPDGHGWASVFFFLFLFFSKQGCLFNKI